jgi:hypothetical protein
MKIIAFLFLLILPIEGICQLDPFFSQLVYYPQFVNPGNLLSKDHSTGAILLGNSKNDTLYGKVKTYINLNVPITNLPFHFGATSMTEETELKDLIYVILNSSIDLRILKNYNMNFCLFLGNEIERIYSFKEDSSTVPNGKYLSSKNNNYHTGFGITITSQRLDIGGSLHYQKINDNYTPYKGSFSIFINGSFPIKLNENLSFKPVFLFSYAAKKINYQYGVLCMIHEKFNVGLNSNSNVAIAIHADTKIYKQVSFGYSYAIWIADGMKYPTTRNEFYLQIIAPDNLSLKK